MVALTLSAIVLLAGRALTEQVAAAGETIQSAATHADSVRVRDRSLRAIVRNIETDTAALFSGDERAAKFGSWCTGAQSVRERCAITLTADSVVMATDSARTVNIISEGAPAVLRYLGDSRDGGRWYRSWGPAIALPLAVGIVTRFDTTVLRIGDRG